MKKKLLDNFSNELIKWYMTNKRDLPWRGSSNPYEIWLSEIILQQTRISQGIEYYKKILTIYPDVYTLSKAPLDEVLKHWQGLGYYTRARNLHTTAKIISEKYNGTFPSTWSELKKLKGIGNYTAAAIASISFNKPVPAIDGNVYRVFSRIFGIKTPINSGKAKKEFSVIALKLFDKNAPGTYNEALMEFGATWCTPKNPKCIQCPFHEHCYARKLNLIDILPVKTKEKKPNNRYFNYLVITENDYIYLKRRTTKDIWYMLYDFPLIEKNKTTKPDYFLKLSELKNYFNAVPFNITGVSQIYLHKLTHQKIHARFYKFKINVALKDKQLLKVKLKDLKKYAVPRLIDKYLKEEFSDFI
jgi:A/G-specific adenine glycosylase